jgi:MFS family permease
VTRVAAYVARFTGFERDARVFLAAALVSGAAISLYWIDFNLYLSALGLSPATIGLIVTAGSLASAIASFPASLLSDRIGRRLVLAGGLVLMLVSTVGFLLASGPLALACLAAAYGAGQQAFFVVQNPFLAERSRPDQRSELFALAFAIQNVTNIAAAVIGGAIAGAVAVAGGFGDQSPEAYRVILVLMAGLTAVAVGAVFLIGDDRPGHVRARSVRASGSARSPGGAAATGSSTLDRSHGEPAAFPAEAYRARSGGSRHWLPIRDRRTFFRLLLPGFLIALGAGQVIPFLNLFIRQKFGLDLTSLNLVFAITSLGTVLAILLQPAIARRFGKMGSVVLVQGASIPFLIVLGFSPTLWTVVAAMAVRNSLMNAGNPIFNAFAMERVAPGERATLSASMSLLWSVGWVIAGPWYSLLQANLGFDAAYAVNFVTIIGLYSVATFLYWFWFGREERAERIRGDQLR